ncbi:MAG: hypothetical protein Q8K04_08665, partial [Lutibacter sp.]|nr:hypothetical protein [Lutibacter sp.]
MKRLLLIIWISIVPLTTFSQVTTVPSNPTDNEEITILFDATGTSLDGYIGDVYAFTGVTVNGGQFSNVLGDWGDNVLNPQLTRDTINLNLYTLLITPTIFDYYGVSTSDNITELVFVFRSADASLQTRPDIFVPIIATNPPPPPPVLSNWGIVGTATPNGWDGPDMPLTYDAISNKWSAVVSLTNGEIKFRDNNIWDFNYGDNEPDGILDRNGANIAIAEGQYLVACDFSALTYAIKPLVSIPDPNFEQALIDLGIDSDGIVNGTILKENVVNIDSLSIGSPLDHSKPFANPLLVNVIAKIGDLTGIESFTNLKYLSAGFNNINSINLSQNTLLEELWINDNDCSFINVSNNPNLKKIGAYVNNLTALDLSNNPLLTHLYLAYNPQLKYLDVRNGNNSNISAFWVYETPNLACINADTINSLVMIDSGKVFDENCGDYAYIPDANFEQALIDLGFDSDGVLNSLILKSDAASIIHLNVNEKNISSLSGIEHFTNLQYLYCNNNLLTTLNLGDKPNLINLDCGRNALTSIDVSNYPKLINLDIWNNQLLSLDVSQNLQLEALIIFTNKLTSLDISVNSKLKFMNFANNKLVNLNIANGNNINFLRPEWATYSFDARNNPALMCIQVDANIINNIPADWFKDEPASYNENCPTINCKELVAIPDANFEQALVDLGYDTNGLTGNIKKCEAASIIDLNVNDKNISSLAGIEHFVGLRYLFCNNNSLSVLDLSSNSNLRGVWANQNFLTAINISNCPNLASLHIWANQLTSLDLSHNPDLEELICSTNKLTTLDVSANSKLKLMNFADNKLVNLNIANGNNINVSGPEWADYSFSATNNPGLSCIQVDENIIGNIPSDWFKDETASYNTNCPIINCEELVAIPDANFEQALIDLGIDTNGLTGDILKCEALSITHLNVNEKNINNLQGIQAFTNLSTLYCQNNQIQVLDISNNTALTILECGGNQLTELNVTQNLLLRVLGFGLNNISEIDVSQNLALEVFWCNNNNITSQNLDLNSTLLVIGLSNNPLTFVSLKNGNNVNVAYFEAYNTPNLACINSDAVVSASMSISGKTFSENCSTTSLAGSWIIAPETRAIKVGPTPGSDLWWYLNKFGDDIASRACYLDDVYVFNENGSFNNVLGSETYLETWQGVAIEGCGAPVTPHDGSTNATYVYDQAGTITLNGQGAYLGLPKVANGYILPNGPVPNSITYDVSFSENGNVMTLGINSGGAFWTYKLIKESVFIPDANFEQALIDLGFDTDGVVNSLISKSDAASIIDLDINNKNISSLAGIEHFVGLRYLFCNNNSLSVLDLSSNSNLRGVWAN